MDKESSVAFVETPPEIAEMMVELIDTGRDARILDTGCGKGIFLEKLLDNGYTSVEGIELNDQRYRYCKSRYPKATIHNRDFLSGNLDGNYDVIIGNPPYMHFDYLPKSVKQKVSYIVKNMECDIYYAFIMKSIDLLKSIGELIYIVPYHFFFNTYANEVRDKLTRHGHFDLVIDLGENALFKDNHPETIIFKWKKVKAEHTMEILQIQTRTAPVSDITDSIRKILASKSGNDIFSYHRMDQYKSYENAWSTHPRIHIPHFRKLGDMADVKVGMLAGYSDGFTVSEEEYKTIPQDEQDAILPFVKSKFCKGYWISGTAYNIVFDRQIRSEGEIEERYPNIYGLLLRHKTALVDRYRPDGLRWWEWSALRNKRFFETNRNDPKLFVPSLDRHERNRFSLSDEFVYGEADVVTIIPHSSDPFFLLGYLNSNFFRKYILSRGFKKGGRVVFSQGGLTDCRIPYFEKEVIYSISEIAEAIYEGKDRSRRSEIEMIIKDAFDRNKFRKFGIHKYFH